MGVYYQKKLLENELVNNDSVAKISAKISDGIDGFCYKYKIFEGASGTDKNITECYIRFENIKKQMEFKLNTQTYSQEFLHFIESIKTNN